MTLDTLKAVRKLEDTGIPRAQAEEIVDSIYCLRQDPASFDTFRCWQRLRAAGLDEPKAEGLADVLSNLRDRLLA